MTALPRNQHIQDLQKTVTRIIPELTQTTDEDILALITDIERVYAHVLIEAGLRGVIEY
jgi:hypothetical protein